MEKVTACATNTSDIRGSFNHDYERAVTAKRSHSFWRLHSAERTLQEDWRMLSLAVRLRCSSSMQGPKGHGEPEAQRQAADTRWAF